MFLPIVLMCTPLIYMDLMSQVFHEYLDRWLVECNVDKLVYATNCVVHGRHLVLALEMLSKMDSSPSLWEVRFGWGSVILGLCNEPEWRRSQHNRTRTHSCTCAWTTCGDYWVCGLHRYIAIRRGCTLVSKDVTYATCQLWIRSSVILLMVRRW
jgi:hypothetical protein